MVNCTEFLQKRLCCLVANRPKEAVSYAWMTSLLLVLIAFIIACVSAAQMAQAGSQAGQAAGFAAVWTALLLVAISVIGTIILRRFNKALSVGILIGIIFVMVQQMLILFAFFAERSGNTNQPNSVIVSQQAMAVFSFFIFLVYLSFGTMLAVFRVDFIKAAQQEGAENAEIEDDVDAENSGDVSKIDYQDH